MSTIGAPVLDPATVGGSPGSDPAASGRFLDLLASMGRDPVSLYDGGGAPGPTLYDPGPLPSAAGLQPASLPGPAADAAPASPAGSEAGSPGPDAFASGRLASMAEDAAQPPRRRAGQPLGAPAPTPGPGHPTGTPPASRQAGKDGGAPQQQGGVGRALSAAAHYVQDHPLATAGLALAGTGAAVCAVAEPCGLIVGGVAAGSGTAATAGALTTEGALLAGGTSLVILDKAPGAPRLPAQPGFSQASPLPPSPGLVPLPPIAGPLPGFSPAPARDKPEGFAPAPRLPQAEGLTAAAPQGPQVFHKWGDGAPEAIHQGQQDKHVPGTNNYTPGRSVLTADPQKLLDTYSGKGQPSNDVPRGQPGFRERFDTGNQVIGTYVDPQAGTSAPTTRGTIIYSGKGAHIVPARPRPGGEP